MTHFEWLMSDRRYMGAAFAARGQTSDAAFDAFLGRHAAHNVHVATCCGATHRRFSSVFSRRVFNLRPPQFAAGSLRQTALSDAVCDLFTCAAAEHFLGSHASRPLLGPPPFP